VATLLKLVHAVTAMLMVLSWLTIARLVTNPAYAQAFGADHLQALVKLNTAATMDEYYVGLAFWALSATVIGWLWLRSGYIPKALAVFGRWLSLAERPQLPFSFLSTEQERSVEQRRLGRSAFC
jgi:hypothetical protein